METAETRKARLQCDSGKDLLITQLIIEEIEFSGISVLGSEESLMGKKTEEVISLR